MYQQYSGEFRQLLSVLFLLKFLLHSVDDRNTELIIIQVASVALCEFSYIQIYLGEIE